MLAKDNEFLQEAAESLYVANSDEVVRQHCLAREDAERRERTQQKRLEEAERRITEAEAKQAEAEAKQAEAEAKRVEDFIKICREFGQTEDVIKERLMKELNLSAEKVLIYMR